MKKYIIFGLILFTSVVLFANSHPEEKNNGIGSSRFPNHYASPIHPKHP